MNSSSILSIRAEAGGGKFSFRVTLATSKGEQEVLVAAKSLTSYHQFRQDVLSKAGIWFAAEEFEGRRGKQNWNQEIADKLEATNAPA
jgi:hypothetical protein